ncbi:DUF4253 domain-containing protein [Asticcacaulis sp.]|uniref:DUF4253 domain-containing protein n=1 Tax=Asticcacaulis sp. TaxID=1872648 RepID=UPI0026081A65|nr:DUF4253 domain-containing protein [Asticcacaulis sp.]
MYRTTRRSVLTALGAAGLIGCKPVSVSEPGSTDSAAYKARVMAAFPYEIVSVPGDKALENWTKLKAAGRGYPVVLGGDEDLMNIAGRLVADRGGNTEAMPESAQTPSQILESAKAIHFPEVLKTQDNALTDQDIEAMVGEWPTGSLPDEAGLSVATDILTGSSFKTVHIVLVPTKTGSEVPAYMKWGGWNACPMPDVQVAALRSWNERFGAELIGMSGDVLNLRLPKPLDSREKALALATEMYRYCPDIVDQGMSEISILAACLMAQRWWVFWWD